MMEWIKCNERLPKIDDDYLTLVVDNGNSKKCKVQRFYKIPRKLEGMFVDSFSNWELTSWDDNIVTHWMPLPIPPQE